MSAGSVVGLSDSMFEALCRAARRGEIELAHAARVWADLLIEQGDPRGVWVAIAADLAASDSGQASLSFGRRPVGGEYGGRLDLSGYVVSPYPPPVGEDPPAGVTARVQRSYIEAREDSEDGWVYRVDVTIRLA